MNNNNRRKKLVLKRSVSLFLNRLLLTVVIVLISLIAIKKVPPAKKYIIENVYEKSFKFAKVKQIYEKYFGNLVPVDHIFKEELPVFNDTLTYTKSNIYKDGVVLSVSKNYMVPSIESGIIVFIGEKEGYGNTVIIEQVNGIEVFYSNIKAANLKLYDYVEKGSLIGEANDEKIYLVFSKEGKFLDYKDYI